MTDIIGYITVPFRLAVLLVLFLWALLFYRDYPYVVECDGGTEKGLT